MGTLLSPLRGQVPAPQDTLLQNDSLRIDSFPIIDPVFSQIRISQDSVEDEVDYHSQDSQIMDNRNKFVYLYGDAHVAFQELSLDADYIEFDLENDLAFAKGLPDSTGKIAGKPIFTDNTGAYKADSMRYNFRTRKAYIYSLTTEYEGGYIHGKQTKIVDDPDLFKDDTASHFVIYNRDALYTTCDHEIPHFGVRSNKQKVVPNKLVVVGPSTVEIGGVPLFWLPFGFFPFKETATAGLIFPRDYEYSPQWGYGIRNIGYYTPIGEKMDLRVTGDIYTRGSWGLSVASNYRKRYKYSGNFAVSYSNRVSENFEGLNSSNTSIAIRLSHTQDKSAHPYRVISGSVNIQTGGGYDRQNFYDTDSRFNTSIGSNFSYRRTFPGKPFSFSASMNHSQNLSRRNMTITLPRANFQTQRLFPFRKKGAVGDRPFYERISIKYDADLQNTLNATDTTLFTQETINNAKTGIRHRVTTSADYKLLKYLNFAPSFNLTEVWNFNTVRWGTDSTGTQIQRIDTVREFKASHQYNFNLSFNTTLYGFLRFKKGWIRGIRHVMRPSVGFSMSPDYTNPKLGYFQEVNGEFRSILANSVYSTPRYTGPQMGMRIGLNNNFEAKLYSKKDSTENVIKLFDNINLSTFYNFIADSFQLQDIAFSGNTRILKGVSSMNIRGSFTPYAFEAGRQVDKYRIKEGQFPIALETLTISLNSSLSGSKIKEWFTKKENGEKKSTRQKPGNSDQFSDLFSSFNLRHTFLLSLNRSTAKLDSFIVKTNNVIYIQGQIPLTDKWNISIGNIGYDFQTKRITYPDLRFTRDLHCWDMSFGWQPQNRTYSFIIRVKDDKLGFIKVPYNKNSYNSFNQF